MNQVQKLPKYDIVTAVTKFEVLMEIQARQLEAYESKWENIEKIIEANEMAHREQLQYQSRVLAEVQQMKLSSFEEKFKVMENQWGAILQKMEVNMAATRRSNEHQTEILLKKIMDSNHRVDVILWVFVFLILFYILMQYFKLQVMKNRRVKKMRRARTHYLFLIYH